MLLSIISGLFMAALSQASPKVFPLSMWKSSALALEKRQSDLSLTMGNYRPHDGYFVNVSIGTPPQSVTLLIDTGSADMWMLGPNACNSSCFGGEYDSSQSTSASFFTDAPAFKITYDTPGSGVEGFYLQDTVQLGGATMTGVTMAQATYAVNSPEGIMGISFDVQESYVQYDGATTPYPNIVDVLVNQSIINTRSYSVYLDDREQATGTLLFGGYDSDKYYGDLFALPMQPNANTGTVITASVVLNAIGITTSNGTSTVAGSFPYAVDLDTGTTLTAMPQDLFNTFVQAFGAESYEGSADIYVVDCSIAQESASVDFQFGGEGGPIIQVPVSEYILPVLDDDGDPATSNGAPVCTLGMSPTPNVGDFLLGDTFLRSAYVVYDLDNQMVYIAQTKFDSTSSNIQEIGNSGPSAGSGSYSTASAVQSASTVQGFGSSSSVGLASASITASASFGANGGAAGFTINSTVQNPAASGTAAAASSSSAGTTSSSGVIVRPSWVETTLLGVPLAIVALGAFM